MTAPRRWLVLADDLTGAADCAIAFAKHGRSAEVIWSEAAAAASPTQAEVLSIDVDSRALPAAQAAARLVATQQAYATPETLLYKKIDSTLRGQPAAELAAQLDALRRAGRAPFVVLTPAYPATGRVTLGGRVVVNGDPLEETTLWARDHSYPNASLPDILASAGVSAEVASLAQVRAGGDALAGQMRDVRARGVGALVCDCIAESDLLAVAEASLRLDDVMWMGSAGLAAALAKLTVPARPQADPAPRRAGATLVVVGSAADASRHQAQALVASGRVAHLVVTPQTLRDGAQAPAWRAAAAALTHDLETGRDTLLQIDENEPVDLSEGATLAASLADLVAQAAPLIGALVLTGGETARATLMRLGVHGIRLIDEVEPGVPLGVSVGAFARPVITKAGAFGGAETFLRCLDRLASLETAR